MDIIGWGEKDSFSMIVHPIRTRTLSFLQGLNNPPPFELASGRELGSRLFCHGIRARPIGFVVSAFGLYGRVWGLICLWSLNVMLRPDKECLYPGVSGELMIMVPHRTRTRTPDSL